MIWRACLLAGVLAALVAVPPASASREQESIFEDHYLLVQQGIAARSRGLDEMLALGADSVRSLVYWREVAPEKGSRKRPRGFKGKDPAAYPPENWDPYDDLVRGTAARGMGLILTPSSPIPIWGRGAGCSNVDPRYPCRPNAKLFGDFVHALATRYSGSYPDENQGGGILPRVSRWSIWNEPNQPGWLYPQFEVRRRKTISTAARFYRQIAYRTVRALYAADHDGDEIMLGELAPIGRDPSVERGQSRKRLTAATPTVFLRELFCMDSRGRRLRGAASSVRGCGSYPRLRVTAFAHHPYTRGGSQPPRSASFPNEITISSISRLKKLLSQGRRLRRLPVDTLPIYYTEYGFQTNPPDRIFGVTLEEQSQYINESDWIAYQDPRIRSVAQYKLVDEGNIANFQTGLKFANGQLKPSWDAYRLPIWVKRSGSNVKVYGQVRPADEGSRETVLIQNSPQEGAPFTTVHTVNVSSPRGHFLVTIPKLAGRWRLTWTPASGGATIVSREARAAAR